MTVYCFFFFKQKTAYEMRISDWSSDVCSSDLSRVLRRWQRIFRHFVWDPAAIAAADTRAGMGAAATGAAVHECIPTRPCPNNCRRGAQVIEILLWIWLVSAVVMTATWAMCWRIGNAGYVDVAWALMMALSALSVGLVANGAPLPRGLVALLDRKSTRLNSSH